MQLTRAVFEEPSFLGAIVSVISVYHLVAVRLYESLNFQQHRQGVVPLPSHAVGYGVHYFGRSLVLFWRGDDLLGLSEECSGGQEVRWGHGTAG
jgi:hypothetical protein